MPLDMSSLASVRAFAELFKRTRGVVAVILFVYANCVAAIARGLPLRLLVNNAGISLVPFATTTDGLESNWGVNYVAQVLLTTLLLDSLVKSAPSRIERRLRDIARKYVKLVVLWKGLTVVLFCLFVLSVSPVAVTIRLFRVRAYGNSSTPSRCSHTSSRGGCVQRATAPSIAS